MPTSSISTNYELDWAISQKSQNIGANTSVVYGRLIVRKTGGSGYYSNNAKPWRVNINGKEFSGTWTYDFTDYSTKTLWSGEVTITHNSDGTKSISSSGYAEMSSPSGSASVSDPLTLTTIPRTSKATLSTSSPTTGTALTINSNRQSSSFIHVVTYKVGAKTGTIDTDMTTSVSWTPPASLFNQTDLLDTAKASGTITVTTKSGSTTIGSVTLGFTLTLQSSAKPAIGTVTLAEANANVTSKMGAAVWVRNQSKVKATFSGTTLSEGSAIASYTIKVGSSAAVSSSGAPTSNPIPESGTVSVVLTVTDKRGRTSSAVTQTISVLNWEPPKITSISVLRVDSAGVESALGTYIKVTVSATVSSLMVASVQKNVLKYGTIAQPLPTGTSITIKSETTHSSTSLSAVTYSFNGPFATNKAYNVITTIKDVFYDSVANNPKTTSSFVVPVGAVALDVGEANLGVGKFWTRGTLDVGGDGYFDGIVSHRNPILIGINKGTTVVPTSTWANLNTAFSSGTTIQNDGYEFGASDINVPIFGYYMVNATVEFGSPHTGTTRILRLAPTYTTDLSQGETRLRFTSGTWGSNNNYLFTSAILKLGQGNNGVNIQVYQDTGSNMTVQLRSIDMMFLREI